MPETSPGEKAYAGYWPALGSTPPVPWDGLSAPVQHAWEAAAQAVLAHWWQARRAGDEAGDKEEDRDDA